MGAVRAINRTVVEAARGAHHRGDLERIVDHIGPLFASTDGHDHALGRVDDGFELLDAEHAHVGKTGSPTLVFFRSQLALFRARTEVFHLGADLAHPLGARILHDGGNKAIGNGHRDGNIGALELQHGVARELHIAGRNLLQRLGQCLDQHVVDRKLHALRFQRGVQFTAQFQHGIEADIDGQVDMRNGLLALGQALGDDLAHRGQFLDLVRNAEILGTGWRRCGCRARCTGCRSRSGGFARLGVLHVVFDDAPVGASAIHASKVDAFLLCDTACQR